MNLYIGYSSALYFWLRGSRGLWLSEPGRATSLAQGAYNLNDVQSFRFPRDPFGPKPLDIMVDDPAKRRNTPEQVCHVWAGPLPERSFVDIGHGVYVASPALCFVQAAAKLSFFELTELGYELCGKYSRTPGMALHLNFALENRVDLSKNTHNVCPEARFSLDSGLLMHSVNAFAQVVEKGASR